MFDLFSSCARTCALLPIFSASSSFVSTRNGSIRGVHPEPIGRNNRQTPGIAGPLRELHPHLHNVSSCPVYILHPEPCEVQLHPLYLNHQISYQEL